MFQTVCVSAAQIVFIKKDNFISLDQEEKPKGSWTRMQPSCILEGRSEPE